MIEGLEMLGADNMLYGRSVRGHIGKVEIMVGEKLAGRKVSGLNMNKIYCLVLKELCKDI